MESMLRQLGLQEYYKEKISLNRLLLIDHNVLNDGAVQTSEDAVWFFLKKLMMVNGTARNVDFTAHTEPCSEEMGVNIADLLENIYSGDDISLHDIVTALFLCFCK
uniref:Uncharacterized protein n=1 Tax=Knipowitschia caucasica TaxID=637954 RepID=A0AAV2KXL5_KNICA